MLKCGWQVIIKMAFMALFHDFFFFYRYIVKKKEEKTFFKINFTICIECVWGVDDASTFHGSRRAALSLLKSPLYTPKLISSRPRVGFSRALRILKKLSKGRAHSCVYNIKKLLLFIYFFFSYIKWNSPKQFQTFVKKIFARVCV